MRISSIAVAALGAATILLISGSAVQAQGGRGFGFGGSDFVKIRLLNEAKVQDDLKLTAEQKNEARKAGESVQGLFTGGQGQQNATQEERQKRRQEMAEKTKTAAEQATKTLSKEQNQRLDQIVLQVRGAQALLDEKVAAELKITDDQRQKLAAIQQQTGQQMSELQQGDREKRAQIIKDAGEKALAVLTDEQRQQFQKMQGAKIELPENLFGGRRRQQ